MGARVFIDTNIWLYGLTRSQDGEGGDKRQMTLDLLSQLTNEKVIIVSAQVINEFHSIYRKAFELRSKYSLSFWDSLITASALDASCETLYTEDMQHGLVIDNKLTITNPFVDMDCGTPAPL